jgi:hypothetical protein
LVIQYQRTNLISLAKRTRRDLHKSSTPLEGSGERECPAQEVGGRSLVGQFDLAKDRPGKLTSPARRRQAVKAAQEVFQVSERRVCRALEQPRSPQRYQGKEADDEGLLTERIITLASQYGRYGYRRITAMLQLEGWQVNHKRVERIWCQEGLKVPR